MRIGVGRKECAVKGVEPERDEKRAFVGKGDSFPSCREDRYVTRGPLYAWGTPLRC